jgi:hypothetical protein
VTQSITFKNGQTLTLDEWQEEVLKTNGKENIALRAGRQVGKSTIISILSGDFAIKNPHSSIMIISATERQAYLLFSKVLLYLSDNYGKYMKSGKDRPTKTEIKLKNGSIIRCLPTGLDGLGIRGYTINLLIADEAAFIPEAVWPAVTPMLSTTGGKIILLSTPFGRRGYFYDCFNNEKFLKWHISSEAVAETRAEPQKTNMREHQEEEKKRMTKLQYAQEYLGEFVDELRQFFSDNLIKECCNLKRRQINRDEYQYLGFFYGLDIARMGGDECAHEILQKMSDKRIEQVENITEKFVLTTHTFNKILELDKIFQAKKIGIDAGSGSLGVAILDFGKNEPSLRSKLEPLNNRSMSLDKYDKRKRALMKEDMYLGMLAMLEKGILKLLDDDDLIASLRSVQYEYITAASGRTQFRIFGNYTHIAEGLIRAAWLANQKSLNLRIISI